MTVIVGFAETGPVSGITDSSLVQYPPGQYLIEKLDDVSRVACAYAAAEYLGYVMSGR